MSLHGPVLVLVEVKQVRFEVGTGHFQTGSPLAAKRALQVVSIRHGQNTLGETISDFFE